MKKIDWLEEWVHEDNYFLLYLDDNDNFIGKAQIEYDEVFEGSESYCAIYHIYVDNEYRYKGYFNKLIEDCLTHIKKMKYEKVGLYAREELVPVYEKYGFVFEDEKVRGEYPGYLKIKK